MRPSVAIAWGRGRLGSEPEAKVLLAHVLDVTPARLPLVAQVTDAQGALFEALVAQRAEGVPLQHLTGRAYFRTVEVEVGPGVFIPRPETELLAGWALEVLRSSVASAARHARGASDLIVVELCAGSGALSKALATEFEGPRYHAVELSGDAWPYLTRNLAGTGVEPLHADMAGALPHLDGRVDLVVVNPPYIPDAARATLPPDVLRDPDLALFSGPDGLDALRVVAREAARLLRPGGWLGAEHDDTQCMSAPALVSAAGFTDVEDHRDLAGRPRYVTARAGTAVPGRMAP